MANKYCIVLYACRSLAPLVETKKKKKSSYFGFFFTPPLFLATTVAISYGYCSPKTIKCTQKPKIEKRVNRNRPIEPASERVPFSTSYLQLALAHARNSRVEKELNGEDVVTFNNNMKKTASFMNELTCPAYRCYLFGQLSPFSLYVHSCFYFALVYSYS